MEILRSSETNFEKALVIDPKHMRSLDGLVSVVTEARDWDDSWLSGDVVRKPSTSRKTRRRSSVSLPTWKRPASEMSKAVATLEIASVHSPDDVGILTRLRDFYEKARAWPDFFTFSMTSYAWRRVRVWRGAYRFAAGGHRARSTARGASRPRRCSEMATTKTANDRALGVVARPQRRRGMGGARGGLRAADQPAGGFEDRDRAVGNNRKLGTVSRDRLVDGRGPQGFARCRRAARGRRRIARRARGAVCRERERARPYGARDRGEPPRCALRRTETLRLTRAQRPDRAWLVATCLEELGASESRTTSSSNSCRGPISPHHGARRVVWDLRAAPVANPS